MVVITGGGVRTEGEGGDPGPTSCELFQRIGRAWGLGAGVLHD